MPPPGGPPAASGEPPLFWLASLCAHLYAAPASAAGGLLIWGLLSRGLLLVAAVALASLSLQLRGLAGSGGISPARDLLRALRRDFGRYRGRG